MKRVNAKEICARYITRKQKELSEDEEEIIVDYLEGNKIKVRLDEKPRDLCIKVLEFNMKKEKIDPQRVPITAYANNLLGKEAEIQTKKSEEDLIRKEKEEKERQVRDKEKILKEKAKRLPGCVPDEDNILNKGIYELQVDPELGITFLSDNTTQYAAVISFNNNLYNKIFLNHNNPIIELNSNTGFKSYARVAEPHQYQNEVIYISPLVATSLNIKDKGGAFIKLCMYLPEVKKVKFSYLNKDQLNEILPELIEKIPTVINAFSYLSLGMILKFPLSNSGKEVKIQVNELLDGNGEEISVGLIPFGEGDLPFEIE
jgi:hypothetical protein